MKNDTISRQETLEHLRKRLIETAFNNVGYECDAGKVFEDASKRLDVWLSEVPSAQPYTEEQIQKMQDMEQAQLEEAYRLGRESAQPKIGKWVYGSPVTVKCNQCGFYIPDWEAHSSRFCRNCGAKMEG